MADQANEQNRQPQQQDQNPQQRSPQQQNEQRDNQGQKTGERIDTDGDGRTRDPNDARPTDDGGRGEPVQR
jgi:hypothetical protein